MGRLAVDGGQPVRTRSLPGRGLIGPQEKAAAMKVFDEAIASGQAFGYNGPYEQRYERDFAAFMSGGYADGVNSGTNVLYVALGALQLEPFTEVIVPAITDPGGIMPVPLSACIPIVADTGHDSYNVSADQIEPLITERTKTIVVAHISGEPADMDPIMELARARDLYVIEDCAQAHGARYKGKLVGTIGDIGCFSTMFGKHHCTGGQGGAVYTTDEDLYWRAKRFADRGKPFNLETASNMTAGLNCKLNELAAAIGSVQLNKLPGAPLVLRRLYFDTIKPVHGSAIQALGPSLATQITSRRCSLPSPPEYGTFQARLRIACRSRSGTRTSWRS